MKKLKQIAKNILPRPVKQVILAARAIPGKGRRRQLSRRYVLPGGYKRIYFYHIRKTAGTSLNLSFFGVTGQDGESVQKKIWSGSNKHWGIANDYVFVNHDNYLIEGGDYFYAYSHTPSHELRLPPDTFTITIMRDPVKRLISHYRNLMHYKRTKSGPAHLSVEGHWLGDSISDFLDNIPSEHLMRQLYMFSRSFSTDEALEKLAQVNFVGFTENFSNMLQDLSTCLDLDLKVYHGKSSYLPVEIGPSEQERLRDMLEQEYKFVQKAKKYLGYIQEST